MKNPSPKTHSDTSILDLTKQLIAYSDNNTTPRLLDEGGSLSWIAPIMEGDKQHVHYFVGKPSDFFVRRVTDRATSKSIPYRFSIKLSSKMTSVRSLTPFGLGKALLNSSLALRTESGVETKWAGAIQWGIDYTSLNQTLRDELTHDGTQPVADYCSVELGLIRAVARDRNQVGVSKTRASLMTAAQLLGKSDIVAKCRTLYEDPSDNSITGYEKGLTIKREWIAQATADLFSDSDSILHKKTELEGYLYLFDPGAKPLTKRGATVQLVKQIDKFVKVKADIKSKTCAALTPESEKTTAKKHQVR